MTLDDPILSTSEYGLADDECVWVTRLRVGRGKGFGLHAHPQAQILWVASGQMILGHDDETWLLPPSRAAWLPGMHTHEVRVTRDAELYYADFWEEECDVPWTGPTLLSMSALTRELMVHLARPSLDDAAARHARATLLTTLEPSQSASNRPPLPTDARALRVAEAVLSRPADPHALERWARALHTSEKTLQRAFEAQTGMTWSEWRTQARLSQALPLLADELPVSAVAARIGYASTNGFTAAFRRHFGTTPASYYADAG